MPKAYLKTKATGEVFETNRPDIFSPDDYERLPLAEGKSQYIRQHRAALRRILSPGDMVYCVLRYASASGVQQEISLFVVQDGDIKDITPQAAGALDREVGEKGGIVIDSFGAAAHSTLVYALGHSLFPDGFGLKGVSHDGIQRVYARPKSPAEAGEMLRNGFHFDGTNRRVVGWEDEGGFAFECKWM